MNSDLLQGFYLGDLRVEPLNGQVTGNGAPRHLPPKAAEVLLCLAEHPGELVTRENLLLNVWGSGHGSNEALGHAISEIRHALDDHAENPHFIQTLPRRGYRLAVTPTPATNPTDSIVIGANNAAVQQVGFLENLKRRGVFETALAYLIVGWLLIQVADIVFEQLHVPDWAGTYVTAFVIAGFPIAVILSWFLEFRDGKAVVHELSPADARRQRFTRTYISVVGALTAASVLVYAYDLNIGLPKGDAVVTNEFADLTAAEELAISDSSIAVLPFLNRDGSQETQTFADGFVDDVITRLSRVPGLFVSARGDSFTLQPGSDSDQVRKRLRVAMYLEGSVQIANDQMRIIVQLIDSANGFHILSRTFDRPTEDFFDIRDQVTDLTVSSLRVTLPENTQAMSAAATKRPDISAYILYRRGIDESRKPQSVSTIASALGWFDAALEVDPDYAAAYAGKCSVYAGSFTDNNDPAAIIDAEAACAKALALNPNLDIVHTALAGLYRQTGKTDDAEAAYLEALRINPTSVVALSGLGDVYRLQKRPGEAEDVLRQAIGLQPGNSSPYYNLGFFQYQQGRYEEAALQFANVVAIDSNNMRGYANLAASLMLAGNFAAAIPASQKSVEIEPQSSNYSNLGLMYYYLGRTEEAVEALHSAIALTPNAHLTWSNLGDVLSVDGRHEEAREAYSKAKELAASTRGVNPKEPGVIMDMAWIYAMLGDQDQAMVDINSASAMVPDDPYADYIMGLIYHRFGNTDAALAALKLAADKGYSLELLAAEPLLAELRADSRFETIIRAD